MTPEGLRVAFGHAIAEPRLRQDYFDGLDDLLSELVRDELTKASKYESREGTIHRSKLPEILRQRVEAWHEILRTTRRPYPYEDRELKLEAKWREDPALYEKIMKVLGECHKRHNRLLKECYQDGRGRSWYELTNKEKAALGSAYDEYNCMVDSFETAESRAISEGKIRIPFSRPSIDQSDIDAVVEVLKRQEESEGT